VPRYLETSHINSKERISDHDLCLSSTSLSNYVVAVQPVLSYSLLEFITCPTSGFVEELDDRHTIAKFLDNVSKYVHRTSDVLRIQCPRWFGGALPRVIVPILRSRCTMDIYYNMQVMLLCPVDSLNEVRPCAWDVRRWVGGVFGVCRGERYTPVADRYATDISDIRYEIRGLHK
jgi:hypothetical protein